MANGESVQHACGHNQECEGYLEDNRREEVVASIRRVHPDDPAE